MRRISIAILATFIAMMAVSEAFSKGKGYRGGSGGGGNNTDEYRRGQQQEDVDHEDD